MAYRDPTLLDRLIATICDATVAYLNAQVAAGAQALMLFDSWAGVLSPALFKRHVTAATARVVAGVKAQHPDIPIIGFPRLAGFALGGYVAGAGVDAVGLDTSADLRAARMLVPERMAMQGNLDPMALVAGGTALDEATDSILGVMRGRPFVFNLGHGIVPETPPENVAALVARIKAAS
jgi:uroporphyrinogen decarboxylase